MEVDGVNARPWDYRPATLGNQSEGQWQIQVNVVEADSTRQLEIRARKRHVVLHKEGKRQIQKCNIQGSKGHKGRDNRRQSNREDTSIKQL